MKSYRFTPRYVCSQEIRFDLEDGKLHNVRFISGCDGNLKAISKLVEGQDAARIAELFKGNDCEGRGTSCADQFARAIEAALAESRQEGPEE